MNDGSTDTTAESLEDWAGRDSRVRVIHEPARGLVAALERARDVARGRYLARMDADDRAPPDRFELQLRLLDARPAVGMCGAHVRYFPDGRVRAGARRYQAWLNSLTTSSDLERDLFVECPLAHPTFFMRAEAVEAAGGYRDRGWPEDYDLLLRVWRSGWQLAVVPAVLHEWREGPRRHSRTSETYSPDAFRRCKIHHLIRSRLRDCRELVIWGAGPTGKAMGRALAAEGRPVSAWVDLDPRKIGQEIHGAPVLPPGRLAPAPGRLVLAAVGRAGGREQVRTALRDAGFEEPVNALAVA